MNTEVLLHIGQRIKKFRREKNLRIHEMARKANVSKGLISKIENGRTIPSLPVLISLIKTLDIDLEVFFKDIDTSDKSFYIHKKRNEYIPITKENSVGFDYNVILNQSFSNTAIEAVFLNIKPNARRKKVVTDGYEFLFLLKGKLDYYLDTDLVVLEEGDSLFFDGAIPHVPKNNSDEVATLLVLYIITQEKN